MLCIEVEQHWLSSYFKLSTAFYFPKEWKERGVELKKHEQKKRGVNLQ